MIHSNITELTQQSLLMILHDIIIPVLSRIYMHRSCGFTESLKSQQVGLFQAYNNQEDSSLFYQK